MPTPPFLHAETILDPYIGLRPYTDSDDDRARFFGREEDQEIIIANLYAAPLTIFYGASGVGKSSVLLAGVVPELRQTPQFACVVFRTWQLEKVLPELKVAILSAVQVAAKKEIMVDAALRLDDFLLKCAQAFRGRIVLIFDQFEEYFLYHATSGISEGFDAEFARSVNRSEIDASFLLSMREDGLSKLDRFQGRIPKLLNNLLRLDYLDRDAAIRAMRGPLAACNKGLPPGEAPASIDDDLVETLLDQVKTDTATLDRAKQPAAAIATATPVNSEMSIETPFLQVVLTRLWDEEKKHGSRQLRLATLKNLGGAPKILRTHLDQMMRKLRWRERRIAANIFGYLVTPSGGKIAHTVTDLASYSRCPKSHLAPLLERLTDSKIRVLRTIPPPPGKPEGVRYEIFHDVLGAAIVTWRRRWFVSRRVRRVTGLFAVFCVLGTLAALMAQKRQLSAAVLQEQVRELNKKGRNFREKAETDWADQTNPTRNVDALRNLSLALNFNPRDTRAANMARDLLLRLIWCPPAAPEVRYNQDTLLAAAFAPEGSDNKIFAVAGNGQLLLWNGGRELSPVRSLFKKPQPDPQHVVQPSAVSFSPDGHWLFIIPPTLASFARAESAGQGPLQQQGRPPIAGRDHEPCNLQIWCWSTQKRTYESAGADLQIQRLRGSRTFNFAWSRESDGVVLINVRANDAECAFFEMIGNAFRENVDRSSELNRMKAVALAFAVRPVSKGQTNSIPGYEARTAIAVVSYDSAASTLRKVSVIDADDLQVIPNAMNGRDSILLSEDVQPSDVAWGPGNDQLTLTSWSGIRILDLRTGNVTPVPPPTFRDQFMRIVVGPRDFAGRLVATSLYGRVDVVKVAKRTGTQERAEPVVFRGSIGVARFSSDGERMLILSGGGWNIVDTMRLVDVSPLYRTQEPAPEKFGDKPAPPWLAEIAGAVSGLDFSGDGSLLTLETVRRKYPESKAGNPYEAVWKRFFPDEHTGH
jgi:hypothetical protein